MTTKILDRSRPYGTVVGSHDGGVYHQDGTCFRPDGREVGAAAEPALTPAAAPAPAPVAAEADAATLEDLQALHVSQIKKLVAEAGLTYIAGAGSKAKNIEQLLAV